MISEQITKHDCVSATKVTKSYPIKNLPNTLYEDIFNPEYDGYYFNKFRHGNGEYGIPEDAYSVKGQTNLRKIIRFMESTFLCNVMPETNSYSQNREYDYLGSTLMKNMISIHFIQLQFRAQVECKDDRVFIISPLFCKQVILFNYLKEIYKNVKIVGDNFLIQIMMP